MFASNVRARRWFAALVLMFAVALMLPASALAAESTQTMYRLYNPNTGEHFYTASAGERDSLSRIGWSYEGVGWIAPSSSKTPVYRLYNPYAPGGDHHYTTSAGERDVLVSLGWRSEGVGWYSDDSKRAPVYRQYNPNARTGTHNYTTSKGENDSLVSLGWRGEGVGWYAVEANHNWVPNTKTVHHDAVIEYHTVCNGCGLDFTATGATQADIGEHAKEAMLSGNMACGSYSNNVPVVVKQAYDETVTSGYKCSICGATK